MINPRRIRQLNSATLNTQNSASSNFPRSLIYWMSRDQRVEHNWALLYAQELALKLGIELEVVFCLQPTFLGATLRQYDFMLTGLQEVEKDLEVKNISFQILAGETVAQLTQYVRSNNIMAVVTDFSPLKIGRQWREEVAAALTIPLYEVDAHNCVPAWLASPKLEFGAYTLRPKLWKAFPEFQENFPEVKVQRKTKNFLIAKIDWAKLRNALQVDQSVQPVIWLSAGEQAAQLQFEKFLDQRLNHYDSDRNDPNLVGQSDLSPYFHFGQLSAQYVIQDLLDHVSASPSRDAFVEELFVRRELADNFCLYNADCDNMNGFANWAKKSLAEHADDPREYIYSQMQFEQSATHDELWNAAQRQLTQTGKMHGYMRMYWAKKILEWTKSPTEAMEIAIFLNDRYELDGRDPNGYAGIAWAIGGTHDRAWFDRPVYGKIRYMNANGAQKKFDVKKYVASF